MSTEEPQTPDPSSTATDPSPAAAASSEGATAKVQEMSAFVLGYTGEVGKEVVKELARRKDVFKRVVLMGRREVEFEDKTLDYSNMEQKQVNFDDLESQAEIFKGLDVGFCCLGTSKAKSGKEGQYKVDHDYPVKAAEIAKQSGCSQYHLVTSQGSNAKSSFYYPKIKGEAEEHVKAIGIPRTVIYRPGLLMCDRKESRPSEWLARKLCAPIDYLAPGNISNQTSNVAKAMVNFSLKESSEPVSLFDPKAIHKLATEKQ